MATKSAAVIAGEAPSTSLQAQRSNPSHSAKEEWIASLRSQ
jgi:hypothetical protein